MSRNKPNSDDVKMLPGSAPALADIASLPHDIAPTTLPNRQLSEVPLDELENLAEEFGLSPKDYKTRQQLVAAMHERRQMIASFGREALLDVIRWGRRPVMQNATKEQMAQEIVRIKSMRFAGLSQQGLFVLAKLRGVQCSPADEVPALVKRLKKSEGFFTRLNRKRRALLGSIVSNMIGENPPTTEYQFLPPTPGDGSVAGAGSTSGGAAHGRSATIKEDIEEAGLFGGIAGRIKKSADQYLNQKLDEIEQRIDRKLDEIDRRLGDWRDKEIASRIKILKITLWASVIVGAFSLIYAYIVETFRSVPPPAPGQMRDTRPAGK